jgi:hypothetical protein
MPSRVISKHLFQDNIGEFLWSGSGRSDFESTGEDEMWENQNETFDRWFNEWVILFNEANPHNQVSIYRDEDKYSKYYVIRTTRRFNKEHSIVFPKIVVSVDTEELYTIDANEANGSHPITCYSIVEDSDEE